VKIGHWTCEITIFESAVRFLVGLCKKNVDLQCVGRVSDVVAVRGATGIRDAKCVMGRNRLSAKYLSCHEIGARYLPTNFLNCP